MRTIICLLGIVVISALGQATEGATVTHIGIVVRNVERSARAYADLVGVAPPTIEKHTPDTKVALVHLSNVTLELIEPTGNDGGTYRHFLDTRGQGVHHIGLENDGIEFKLLDLTSSLGLMIEDSGDLSRPARVTQFQNLGRPTCITHLGIVVRDIEGSRQTLADLLDVTPPTIGEFNEPNGRAQYTVFNLENISIELLQQIGERSGTYAEFLNTHGQRAHHIGLHLRRVQDSFSMAEQIAWFERHGGVMAINAGGFAYVELRSKLGLFVEALPDTSNDRTYPHPHDVP